MENINISLSESGPGKDISEIRVDGVIDTLTAGEFEEVLDALVRRGRYRVLVDLAGVDYISSAGWGIFISHIKDVRNNEGDIKLANMIPNVHEIYELLEFDNVLKAYGSIDEARSDFSQSNAMPPGNIGPTEATEVRVISPPVSPAPSGRDLASGPTPLPIGSDLETMVLSMVKEDPFATISEIRAEVFSRNSSERPGWWKIFSILKTNGLLRKRSRFRFAQPRRLK